MNKVTSRTPLLHASNMSSSAQHTPDLTVAIGGSTAPATPYYNSAHPLKGYVNVGNSVSIYYEVHGLPPGGNLEQAQHLPKVVMIMGLACGCSGWRWQLQDLVQQHQLTPDFLGSTPNHEQQEQQQRWQEQQLWQQQQEQEQYQQLHTPEKQQQQQQQHWQQQGNSHTIEGRQQQQQQQHMLVCILDNRGVGNSSSPKDPSVYTTKIMAHDVLAVMDHLNWSQAHILGFSMGGMIGQALAVCAPNRVASLTLLSTSAGGWQIVPHSWSGLRTAFKMVTARTPEDAADAALHMHFRRRTLKAWVSHLAARRQELLRREYMTPGPSPPQPPHGFKGQMLACWKHSLSSKDAAIINAVGFPVLVIHGRSDKLASAANAEALARRLGAPCVILPGAHFIVRECAGQINMLLSSLVLGRQHITSVVNTPYLDPSPLMQQAWRQVDGDISGCMRHTTVQQGAALKVVAAAAVAAAGQDVHAGGNAAAAATACRGKSV